MNEFKKLNKRAPLVFYVGIILLCFVLVTTYMTSGLYARYTTSVTASDSARVARFNISTDLKAQADTFTLTNIKPGFTQTIELNVENNSEVSVSYGFTVESFGNLPLKFLFNQQEGKFLMGGEQEATHTLTVSWPKEAANMDVSFAYEIDVITIVLTCTQIN